MAMCERDLFKLVEPISQPEGAQQRLHKVKMVLSRAAGEANDNTRKALRILTALMLELNREPTEEEMNAERGRLVKVAEGQAGRGRLNAEERARVAGKSTGKGDAKAAGGGGLASLDRVGRRVKFEENVADGPDRRGDGHRDRDQH